MLFFDLLPCCVAESHSGVYKIYSHKALRSKVDVLVNVHASFNESLIRKFCKGHFNILPMSVHSCSCSSQVLKSICKTIHNNYDFMCLLNSILSTCAVAKKPVMHEAMCPCTQECVIVESHHIMNVHDQFMEVNTI